MEGAQSNKRTIEDFFAPKTKRPFVISSIDSVPPFRISGTNADQVPGLELHPDFITESEEKSIQSLLNDSARFQWRTDLSRRTMHFGGSYCLMPPRSDASSKSKVEAPKIIQAPPVPDELSWLIQRLVDKKIFDSDKRPQYCIVNEYVGSQGISAHTENFQFEEPIVGLSLLRACPIRFHELLKRYDGSVRSGKAAKAEKTGRRIDVEMPGRSLLVMRGNSRWQWQHEILRHRKGRDEIWKRISLTFRYKAEA